MICKTANLRREGKWLNVNDVNGEFTVLRCIRSLARIFESVITRLNRSRDRWSMNVQHQISSCQSGLCFALFFQHGIDHIGTHHIATVNPVSGCQPSIPINALLKCTVGYTGVSTGQPYFRFFSGTPTEQNNFTRRVFQQMRDVAATVMIVTFFFCSPRVRASRAFCCHFR